MSRIDRISASAAAPFDALGRQGAAEAADRRANSADAARKHSDDGAHDADAQLQHGRNSATRAALASSALVELSHILVRGPPPTRPTRLNRAARTRPRTAYIFFFVWSPPEKALLARFPSHFFPPLPLAQKSIFCSLPSALDLHSRGARRASCCYLAPACKKIHQKTEPQPLVSRVIELPRVRDDARCRSAPPQNRRRKKSDTKKEREKKKTLPKTKIAWAEQTRTSTTSHRFTTR